MQEQQLQSLTKNIDIDILVDIAMLIGGIATIVAGVSLGEVVDGDPVIIYLTAEVRWSLTDGHTIVDPLFLGRRFTSSLAVECGSLAFSLVLEFWFTFKEWDGWKKSKYNQY